MNPKITSLLAQKEIEIQWTDKPVTPWGGLSLFSGLAVDRTNKGHIVRRFYAFFAQNLERISPTCRPDCSLSEP